MDGSLTQRSGVTISHHDPGSEVTTQADTWGEIYEHRLSDLGYILCAIYLTIVGVLATSGNAFIILTLTISSKLRKKPQNLLLLNLAVSDLGISIFGYPYTASSNYARRWLFKDTFCKIYAFMCFFLSETSYATLVAISVYRYIFICKPHSRTSLSKSTTYKVICLTWVFGVMWPVWPFAGWSSYTYEPFRTSCSVEWMAGDAASVAYDVVLIVVCYLLPLAVLIFCYGKITVKARQFQFQNSERPGIVKDALKQKRDSVETRTTLMCVLMVLGFLVAWTPYAVICLMSAFMTLPTAVLTVPTMLAKSSPCINCLIYTMLNKNFRKAAQGLWRMCSREVTPLREHSYIVGRYEMRKVDPAIFSVEYDREGVYLGTQQHLEPRADTSISQISLPPVLDTINDPKESGTKVQSHSVAIQAGSQELSRAPSISINDQPSNNSAPSPRGGHTKDRASPWTGDDRRRHSNGGPPSPPSMEELSSTGPSRVWLEELWETEQGKDRHRPLAKQADLLFKPSIYSYNLMAKKDGPNY